MNVNKRRRSDEGAISRGKIMNQTTPERALLERFVAWNRKWPASCLNASLADIVNQEIELDDLMGRF